MCISWEGILVGETAGNSPRPILWMILRVPEAPAWWFWIPACVQGSSGGTCPAVNHPSLWPVLALPVWTYCSWLPPHQQASAPQASHPEPLQSLPRWMATSAAASPHSCSLSPVPGQAPTGPTGVSPKPRPLMAGGGAHSSPALLSGAFGAAGADEEPNTPLNSCLPV